MGRRSEKQKEGKQKAEMGKRSGDRGVIGKILCGKTGLYESKEEIGKVESRKDEERWREEDLETEGAWEIVWTRLLMERQVCMS